MLTFTKEAYGISAGHIFREIVPLIHSLNSGVYKKENSLKHLLYFITGYKTDFPRGGISKEQFQKFFPDLGTH